MKVRRSVLVEMTVNQSTVCIKTVSPVGSIYEPLKLSILQREDEPLWEKLDRHYNAGEFTDLLWLLGNHTGMRQFHYFLMYRNSFPRVVCEFRPRLSPQTCVLFCIKPHEPPKARRRCGGYSCFVISNLAALGSVITS